ncbi:MAG: septum formation initiator [Sphingomonas sp. 28-66-16]|nr:MAG: septum formation initiator [Sphingomonas sp. 28-66-16]
MAFFGGYAVLGTNGILAYGQYKRELVRSEAVYASLDKRRAVMRNRVALLDPGHANPDMVDEQVRKQLKLTHPDELVIPLGNEQ